MSDDRTLGPESATAAVGAVDPAGLCVIHNPVAGGSRARRFAATLEVLERRGHHVAVQTTAGPGDAGRLARSALARGHRRIVVAGGDGTVDEAINALAGSAAELAILPLGTANVLAAEIGLELHPAEIARCILDGPAHRISLGRIRGADGEPRLFSIMAGVGFDAHVVAGVDLALKRRIGKAAYIWESLRQLRRFAFPRYHVTLDDGFFEAASVVVAKGHFYAGRYVCAPEARLRAPELHVCLFERAGPWAALAYLVALQRGTLPERRDYRILTCGTGLRIAGPVGDPVQADGDAVAALPVEIDVLPDALALVHPPA